MPGFGATPLREALPRLTSDDVWGAVGLPALEPESGAHLPSHALAAVVAATLAGVGVCQAIGFMVREHVAAGRLTRVLADEETDGPPVYVLRRSSARGIPRVAVVLDRLLEELPRLLHPGAAGQARLGRPEPA
ncbi:MAG: hypothetical protein KC656_16975 [Myxococcales bacterium]|nr:hypothetical protein [Myxococcales bacterium]